jgi:putative glutamine amidotransferase
LSAILIGITTTRSHNLYGLPAISLTEAYINAVLNTGAAPVLIPLGLPDLVLDQLLPRLDGLLFSGGGDMRLERYGGSQHPLVDFVDEDRDRVETLLVQRGVERGMPFFGICRGLQVINVALGGTLYEDLSQQYTGALQHDYSGEQPREYLAHPVQIEAESHLAQILGSVSAEVNSLHHQGIRRLAPSLCATAFAPDGVIEGVELPGYPFGLAVQWHPECLQAHTPMRGLFQAFVGAAESYRDGKP